MPTELTDATLIREGHRQRAETTSNRVRGHTLWYEGAPHDDNGRRKGWQGTFGEGRGKCSCGLLSDVLPSGGARKRWHRQHKAETQT